MNRKQIYQKTFTKWYIINKKSLLELPQRQLYIKIG